MSERWLVTGGGGFIGKNLCAALVAAGKSVRVVDDFSDAGSAAPEGVEVVRGDIRDVTLMLSVMGGMDVVVHLAAVCDVTVCGTPEAWDVNVRGTGIVLKAARSAGVGRVVLASSAAVYGEGQAGRCPSRETDELLPISDYGRQKADCERLASWSTGMGLPTIPLRFFNVYGPGQRKGFVPALLRAARGEETLILHGGGRQQRDFVHVDDVVRAIVAAGESRTYCDPVNVGTGRVFSPLGLAARCQEITGKISAEIGDARTGDIMCSCAGVERLAEAFGIRWERRIENWIDLELRKRDDSPREP